MTDTFGDSADDFFGEPMSAHRTRAVATITVGLLALGACSTGTSSGSPAGTPSGDATTSAEPRTGGLFRIGTNGQEPTCLDPHGNASTLGPILTVPFSDSLVWQEEDGTLSPWLAESWDVSEDGLVYTFHLRDGVTFTDGAVFDAEALRVNFEHMVDPATKSPLSASYIAPYSSSRVVDPLTLEVTLSSPYSAFLNVLAQGFLGVISPKQITEAPDTICEAPIGSGPFVVESWNKGRSVEYTKNPDYAWGPGGTHEGPAYLDRLEVVFVTEDATRYSALASGELDAIEFVPPQNYAAVETDPRLETFTEYRPGHPFSLWFNTSRAPFDDVRVRQALIAAVDRQAVVESISFGQWDAAEGYLTPSTPDYIEDVAGDLGHDPDRANDLLDEAGWTGRDSEGYRTKDGQRLVASLPTTNAVPLRIQIAEQTQAAAREVGIDIQIEYPAPQELRGAQPRGRLRPQRRTVVDEHRRRAVHPVPLGQHHDPGAARSQRLLPARRPARRAAAERPGDDRRGRAR
ncbi:ABC transporter substrate-binding protein [Cellulomonas sp. ATA003]|uniref:ABC transporter substrate-binding protein n=1 Tax=Cellulomonas sp. ATA003 TaxID=3073064 RepID=UPI0028736D8F|nr:ABC transporter substrate-binding protein [Cellulomonas sp. ATA003]WNB86783.1 ABC transporter substrate-binding protein [Cellulomonas sp. ATA003]